MANNLSVSLAAGGSGVSAVVIFNWLGTGHVFPLSTEVAAAFAYFFGIAGHLVVVAYNTFVLKQPVDPNPFLAPAKTKGNVGFTPIKG